MPHRAAAPINLISSEELSQLSDAEILKLRFKNIGLEIKGTEIENMMKLQQMGFSISRTHSGEFKVSKETTNEMMADEGGKPPNTTARGQMPGEE